MTDAMTSAAGLPAYEISNHACPATRAGTTSHTGATAIMPASGRALTDGALACAQFVTGNRRTSCPRPRNGHGIAEEAVLSAQEVADEALVMGLAAHRRHRRRCNCLSFRPGEIVDWPKVDQFVASGHSRERKPDRARPLRDGCCSITS